jgi:hypothetical protein
MTMQKHHYKPAFFTFFSLVFVAVLLALEYFNGGVQSHHLLDRPDLPAISNWFGLLILPLLGWLLDVRLRKSKTSASGQGSTSGIWMGLFGAFLYGAALATSFELDASSILPVLFLGLFLLTAIFPIYRIEYIFGFVVGMTFTFGAVLPSLVAAVFATVSFVIRFVFRTLMSAIRRPPSQPPGLV